MKDKTQIMLDIETLGNRPGAVIVTIGAVKFADGQILGEFYRRIDPASCERIGLRMDADTVMWWMLQNEKARLEVAARGGDEIQGVLAGFAEWIGDKDAEVWGNGAAFDNALLAAAYAAAGMRTPWKFTNDRCYRTMKALRPDVPMVRAGNHHHALDDARDQAKHLMEILNFT